MHPSRLDLNGKHLVMLGGKGGVGKTTCAASIALHSALSGRRTIVISSDPAPSLSDIFERRIGDEETAVEGVKNLWASEISSEAVLKRWKEKFGQEIFEVVSSFIPVDYDILDYIGGAPGIEEEFMLSYIVDLVEGGRYDLVVWDTAPAGHTLRLLSLPKLFITHLEGAVKVYMRLHGYLEKLRNTAGLRAGKHSVLDIIDGWKALAEKVVQFINDPEKTEFIVVTIPEALGLYLTERMLKMFDEYGIKVNHMVVNNVVKEADCPFHEKRMEMQQNYLRTLTETYGKRMRIIEVPLLPYEVKGIERINQVSKILFTPS